MKFCPITRSSCTPGQQLAAAKGKRSFSSGGLTNGSHLTKETVNRALWR